MVNIAAKSLRQLIINVLPNSTRPFFSRLEKYLLLHVFRVNNTIIKSQCKIYSVKSLAALNDYKLIAPARDIVVFSPKIFGKTDAQYAEDLNATLPESYVSHLRNVTVIGHTTLVKDSCNRALYDEVAFLNDKKRYAIRSSIITLDSCETIATLMTKKVNRKVNKAIHLLHEASGNYFHWLVECLPRLSLIDTCPEYDKWPILVDKGLPNQFLEALHIFDLKKRPIILVGAQEAIYAKEIAFPSCQSIIRDNYNYPPDHSRDSVIDPEAIRTVRSRICNNLKNKFKKDKKIYLSRKGANYRNIINEDMIEELLVRKGFTIIRPGSISFKEQVSYLSQADTVVCPTGAALSNIIFASPGCKVLSLTSNDPRNNPYFFNVIATALDLEFAHVVGQQKCATHVYQVHNDFSIDLELLEYALVNL